MRLPTMQLFLMGLAFAVTWLAGAVPAAAADKSPQERTKELLVGKWEDPGRPGNGWEFDREGHFAASIDAGVIRSHTGGTYRVLADGSLELRVLVEGQPGDPVTFAVKVTKDKLTFIDGPGKEESYQRTK